MTDKILIETKVFWLGVAAGIACSGFITVPLAQAIGSAMLLSLLVAVYAIEKIRSGTKSPQKTRTEDLVLLIKDKQERGSLRFAAIVFLISMMAGAILAGFCIGVVIGVYIFWRKA